jgi:HPt (histidine-containing phosphotransfer) domain-containing protein
VSSALRAIVGDDDGAIVSLLDLFLAESAPLLDRLIVDAAEGDARAFTQHAHTLKSNVGSFGATQLAETCRQLEASGRSGELGGVQGLLDAARRQLGQLVTEVRALREELV